MCTYVACVIMHGIRKWSEQQSKHSKETYTNDWFMHTFALYILHIYKGEDDQRINITTKDESYVAEQKKRWESCTNTMGTQTVR